MVAAARAASRTATGAAADEAGNEARLSAVTAVAAVASGAVILLALQFLDPVGFLSGIFSPDRDDF
jgi:hypothetical protein